MTKLDAEGVINNILQKIEKNGKHNHLVWVGMNYSLADLATDLRAYLNRIGGTNGK